MSGFLASSLAGWLRFGRFGGHFRARQSGLALALRRLAILAGVEAVAAFGAVVGGSKATGLFALDTPSFVLDGLRPKRTGSTPFRRLKPSRDTDQTA